MESVTISPKYQVVIPKGVRRRLSLSPGDAMMVIDLGDRIELLPARPASELRGLIKGRKASFQREKKDRI